MSRCFPYPSQSRYSAHRDRNESLIESIKLQRGEREKAKAERKKERKREIKEKTRENKVNGKRHVSELVYGEKRKSNDEKIHKWEKDTVDLRRHIQKSKEDEAEQLERSGLTEEHEQPVCPNSCYSADSTQNINKRKRQASPVIVGIRAHGKILRIQLAPRKHKDPDVTVSEERLCSTSGRTETTGKQSSGIGHGPTQEEFCPTSVETDVCVRGLTPRFNNKEQSFSTSGGIKISTRDNSPTTSGSMSSENGILRVESLYKDLVENWVPLQRELTDVDDELEWLFQKKHHPGKESSIASSDVLCIGRSSTLWPRAQYLPGADIYALPFTVPF